MCPLSSRKQKKKPTKIDETQKITVAKSNKENERKKKINLSLENLGSRVGRWSAIVSMHSKHFRLQSQQFSVKFIFRFPLCASVLLYDC